MGYNPKLARDPTTPPLKSRYMLMSSQSPFLPLSEHKKARHHIPTARAVLPQPQLQWQIPFQLSLSTRQKVSNNWDGAALIMLRGWPILKTIHPVSRLLAGHQKMSDADQRCEKHADELGECRLRGWPGSMVGNMRIVGLFLCCCQLS